MLMPQEHHGEARMLVEVPTHLVLPLEASQERMEICELLLSDQVFHEWQRLVDLCPAPTNLHRKGRRVAGNPESGSIPNQNTVDSTQKIE